MEEKVCAVVVTYNRLNYLKRLISCLNRQTYAVSKIIIVDNGSKDGTREWLNGQNYSVIFQDNVGSAGGFYSGIATAMKSACDYMWIMDDDGHPADDCLEKLMTSRAKKTYANNVVLCSIVVNEDNPGELSFPAPDLKSRYYKVLDHYVSQTDKVDDIKSYNDPCGYPWGFFFNSILLHSSIHKASRSAQKRAFYMGR